MAHTLAYCRLCLLPVGRSCLLPVAGRQIMSIACWQILPMACWQMMPIACWLGPVGIAYCLLAERQTGSHTDSVQCSDVACMSESALSVASGCSTHILLTHPWRPAGHPLCLRRVQPPLAHTSDMYAGPRTLSILLLCPILQAYLKHCLQYILDNCSEDLEFFAHQNDKALVQRLQVCIHIPCQASRIGKLGPALPCPILPCPALPCPALPCPALPCPALPCPALPCPVCTTQLYICHGASLLKSKFKSVLADPVSHRWLCVPAGHCGKHLCTSNTVELSC